MPLRKGASRATIRANVAKLVREGMPRGQAVAASLQSARDTARKGQRKPSPNPNKHNSHDDDKGVPTRPIGQTDMTEAEWDALLAFPGNPHEVRR